MVNSDWRDRVKAAFERTLAPDSGSLKSKKARATAKVREAAAGTGVVESKAKDA